MLNDVVNTLICFTTTIGFFNAARELAATDSVELPRKFANAMYLSRAIFAQLYLKNSNVVTAATSSRILQNYLIHMPQ